jgi:hypothetical protein
MVVVAVFIKRGESLFLGGETIASTFIFAYPCGVGIHFGFGCAKLFFTSTSLGSLLKQ